MLVVIALAILKEVLLGVLNPKTEAAMNRKRIRELLWAGAILLSFVALMAALSQLF